MKLSGYAFTIALCASGTASAGGLLLPGAGAVSTARAGASVASTDDGEALSINPAGIAKAKGTTITIGFAAIDYFMSFKRAGTYDNLTEEAVPYAGQPYPTITNDPKPPLGIGGFQPVPVIAIISDLGGRIPGLHVGVGIYAPNAYPFRDMNNVNGKPYFVPNPTTGYGFPTFGSPPPPTRYDIIHEEAAIVLPSIAVAYSILPNLDVGGRFSLGFATLNSSVAVWGEPENYEENVKADGLFTLNAKDNFVTTWALGATWRPTSQLEFGANYTAPIDIHAQGDAESVNGPNVTLNGAPIQIEPILGSAARCADGGTSQVLKGCVDVELPMTAQLGARYKVLDEKGRFKGDIEVDLDWEHWGASCDYTKDPNCLDPSDFHVTVDGQVATAQMPMNGIDLKTNLVTHGLQDTYAVRVGGSWVFPVAENAIVVRGGIGYDTAAAQPGWERADLDGAARTMLSAGGSYKMHRVSFDAGFGVILEGTRTANRNCDPTAGAGMGCAGNGQDAQVAGWSPTGPFRQGPDPINPIIAPNVQAESPVNQGTFTSHYLMFMLGASTWF